MKIRATALWRDRTLGYAVAVVAPVATTALRLWVGDWLIGVPFILLFPSVTLAAYLGGFGPGILALAVSVLLSVFALIEPRWSLDLAPGHASSVVVFALVGGFQVWLVEKLRRVLEENRAGHERERLLRRELQHRVANLLQLIISMTAMQSRGEGDPAARADLRKEWGVEDDQVVVGMVGRLVVEKGYPELFAAAAGMDERYVFVVVGPEDPEKSDAVPPAVIETARARGVRFLGMRTDVEEIFSAFDLMVLPSHREGFPRAAMEAAAMGLPIVATNIRGCRQVVEQGVNGLLVPVDDPRALREAIETLGEDADLRASMGRASRAKALGEFDEDRVVEIVMDTYRRGLMRKGLGHLLPAAMLETTSIGEPRRAGERDVAAIASLHSSGINTGFLPKLGPRFMRVLYRAMAGWPGAVVLVIDDEGGPVAFVAGVTDTGAFYKHFLRHFGLRAILAAFPRILRPSVLRSAWESFRYGEEDHREVPAELISMAVAPRARRSGLSLRLGAELQRSLSALGTTEIKVVVGSDNQPAIAAYQRMGFVFDHRIEVHAGQDSDVLVWRA